MVKKWSHPIGELNKQKIFNIIHDRGPHGAYLHEIVRLSGLTKPSVIKNLKVLKEEKRVSKTANIYFSLRDEYFDYVFYFPNFINIFLGRLMQRKDELDNLISLIDPKKPTEKSVYQFVNAVGAVILYVLIESKRMIEMEMDEKKATELTEFLLADMLPLKRIFEIFGHFFGNLPTDKPYQKMRSGELDRLSNAFRQTYSRLNSKLEEDWKYYSGPLMQTKPQYEKHRNYKHAWNEEQKYRLGKYERCTRCGLIKMKSNI